MSTLQFRAYIHDFELTCSFLLQYLSRCTTSPRGIIQLVVSALAGSSDILLVPEGTIHPVVNVLVLTWVIRYIHIYS